MRLGAPALAQSSLEEGKAFVLMMSCEEFERFGLDMDRADAEPSEAVAASEHAARCARCRALLASWRDVKQDLRLLRQATLVAAPPRVEMRLKQQLRTRREARVPSRSVSIATWAVAAAVLLAAGLGWKNWRNAGAAGGDGTSSVAPGPASSAPAIDHSMLMATDYDNGAFTRLPGSLPSPHENQEILQVRMQRGALRRFGLPVAQDHAADWVQVDFLIGEDGSPQAVRLHRDAQPESTVQ